MCIYKVSQRGLSEGQGSPMPRFKLLFLCVCSLTSLEMRPVTFSRGDNWINSNYRFNFIPSADETRNMNISCFIDEHTLLTSS